MNSKLKSFGVLLLVMGIVWIQPTDSHAYLDPGTGSMILQTLIGGIAASFTTAALFWSRIKMFFGGRRTNVETKQLN